MKRVNTLKRITELMQVRAAAEKTIQRMSPQEKKELELQLDVEHAYYSSALEGSKVDRKTFDELAKQ